MAIMKAPRVLMLYDMKKLTLAYLAYLAVLGTLLIYNVQKWEMIDSDRC